MPTSRYIFDDTEGTQPSLALAQSFWALQMRELSVEASLDLAVGNGYRFLEAGLSAERMPILRGLLTRFPLKLIAQGWATTADGADAYLQRAAGLGAVCINFHLGHSFLSVAQSIDLIGALQAKAASFGLPFLLETHRGRLTQDLLRLSEIVVQVPDLLITLDVSHYIVAGEGVGGDSTEFFARLETLTERAALIHGRISDGQSVQVHSADPLAATGITQQVWTGAMRSWLASAPARAMLVFEPELGPPPYAARQQGREESWSRTQETEELVRLAQECWRTAQAERAPS